MEGMLQQEKTGEDARLSILVSPVICRACCHLHHAMTHHRATIRRRGCSEQNGHRWEQNVRHRRNSEQNGRRWEQNVRCRCSRPDCRHTGSRHKSAV